MNGAGQVNPLRGVAVDAVADGSCAHRRGLVPLQVDGTGIVYRAVGGRVIPEKLGSSCQVICCRTASMTPARQLPRRTTQL